MQQNVTCPEVPDTRHSINRFATHCIRVALSLVTKCESATTDQRVDIRVQNGNSQHILPKRSLGLSWRINNILRFTGTCP